MSSPDRILRTRLTGLCLGFVLLFTGSLKAQERLTSASLSAWNVSGKTPIIDAGSGAITLPADGQLYRVYSAGHVTVHLLSRPYFQARPDNWPALEIGPAALTFLQNGAGGGMVLLGDTALTLPQAIALAADGRSVRPIDLSLDYDQVHHVAVLLLDGTSYTLAATGMDREMAVAVSAGGDAAWTLDLLEVSSGPGSTAASGKSGDSASVDPEAGVEAMSPAADAATLKRTFAEAKALFKAGDFAGAERVLFSTNRSRPGTLGWQTESAGKLTRMALALRQEYFPKVAILVARRGIEILAEGARLARTARPAQRAAVHEMAAFLDDELLHDLPATRAEYVKALMASPDSPRTREGLDRLDEAQAKSQRLSHPR